VSFIFSGPKIHTWTTVRPLYHLIILQEERLYGINENTRAIKAQVIHSLNQFVTSNGLGTAFTDLCR
jgi:hypothetical protein